MRLVTFEDDSGPRAGILVGDRIVPAEALDAPAATVRGLLEALDAAGLAELGERAGQTAADEHVARTEVRLLAPVPRPEKIICIGLNYRDHAAEAEPGGARRADVRSPSSPTRWWGRRRGSWCRRPRTRRSTTRPSWRS